MHTAPEHTERSSPELQVVLRQIMSVMFQNMSYEAAQVKKFYDVVWNEYNRDAIPEILDERVKFRGSLGQDRFGHAGFAEYLDMVHEALGDYRCTVEELVSEPPRVFAKMRFSGIHRGRFMGYPPTGRRLTWSGAALFAFAEGKVVDLWVLGDLRSLENQLDPGHRKRRPGASV